MLAKVYSCAIIGLDAEIVEVEVDINRGQVNFMIVGLPDAAVRESRDRVHAAIKNSGSQFIYMSNPEPHHRVALGVLYFR